MIIFRTEGDYVITYDDGDGDVYIRYNVCEYTYTTCGDDDEDDYAHYTDSDGDCHHMSSSNQNDISISFIDEAIPYYGLVMTYNGGDSCNETHDYVLTLQLNCYQYGDDVTYEIDTSTIGYPCTPTIIMQTPASCPSYTFGTLYVFFSTYYYLFGVALILLGLFLITFGGRFYKITMFMAATFAVSAFILIITYLCLYPTYSPMWLVWMTLICSLSIGSGAGYGAQKWSRVGVLFIGTWVGGIFGCVLYVMFVHLFINDNEALAVWITIAFSAVITAVLSMVFFDYAVIIGAALGGGYSFIRVITIFCS